MATPVSARTARALEQVKMGLHMLYGAAYFTEDEWVKIDGLIHKGNYVFTNGPCLIDGNFDGDLMPFDDGNDKPELAIQKNPNSSPDTVKEDACVGKESQVDSPTESDRADFTTEPAETPNDTSIEASSDDERPAKMAQPDPAMFDFSHWDNPVETAAANPPERSSDPSFEPASTELPTEVEPNIESSNFEVVYNDAVQLPKCEPIKIPAAGGLALGYTQAQLDEVKAFNRNLTRAGKKGVKRRGISPSPSSQPSPPRTYAPTPSEHETRIQSWASEVDAEEAIREMPSPGPVVPVIAKEFTKTYGRPPKNFNDLVQPNNPAFVPLDRRSPSQILTKTQKGRSCEPQVKVAPGTILIAQSSQQKRSTIELEVLAGDRLRMLIHVSGIMHQAQNMRTNLRGQISENVFKKSPGAIKVDPVVEQERAMAQRKPSISSTLNGLDAMERRNAAEWDEVPITNRRKPVIAKPKAFGFGLGSSRFASLDETKSVSSASEDMMSREEVAKMVDDKFAQLIASRNPATPTGPRKKPSMKDPLLRVTPKTVTCWFWATPSKSCRFTADECRDLHAFLPPSSSSPANLRMGKPSWGALADCIPPPTTDQIEAQIVPSSPLFWGQRQGEFMRDSTKAFKTCWYWANESCQNTAEACKYLHHHCAGGIAPKPTGSKNNWSRWGKSGATDEFGRSASCRSEKAEDRVEEEEEGELVLETLDDGTDWKEEDEAGWGESAQPPGEPGHWTQDHLNNGWGGDADNHKPPHIKALEEKSLKEQVGW